MFKRIKNGIEKVTNVVDARAIVKSMSSPKVVAVAKVFIATVALFQALDALTDSSRKIGFKTK